MGLPTGLDKICHPGLQPAGAASGAASWLALRRANRMRGRVRRPGGSRRALWSPRRLCRPRRLALSRHIVRSCSCEPVGTLPTRSTQHSPLTHSALVAACPLPSPQRVLHVLMWWRAMAGEVRGAWGARGGWLARAVRPSVSPRRAIGTAVHVHAECVPGAVCTLLGSHPGRFPCSLLLLAGKRPPATATPRTAGTMTKTCCCPTSQVRGGAGSPSAVRPTGGVPGEAHPAGDTPRVLPCISRCVCCLLQTTWETS